MKNQTQVNLRREKIQSLLDAQDIAGFTLEQVANFKKELEVLQWVLTSPVKPQPEKAVPVITHVSNVEPFQSPVVRKHHKIMIGSKPMMEEHIHAILQGQEGKTLTSKEIARILQARGLTRSNNFLSLQVTVNHLLHNLMKNNHVAREKIPGKVSYAWRVV